MFMCVYVDVNKIVVISAFKTPLYLYAQVKRNLEIVQTRCMQISAEIVSKSKPRDLYHTVHYYCVVGIMEVWVFLLKLSPNNQPHFSFITAWLGITKCKNKCFQSDPKPFQQFL